MDQALARVILAWNKSDEEFEQADRALNQWLTPHPTRFGVFDMSHGISSYRESDDRSGGPEAEVGKRRRSVSEEDPNEARRKQRKATKDAAKSIAAQIDYQLGDAINRSTRDSQILDITKVSTTRPTSFFSEVAIEDRIKATNRAVTEHLLTDGDRHAYYCDGSVRSNSGGAAGAAVAWKEDPTAVRSRWVARGFSIRPGFTSVQQAEGIAMVQALHIAIERTAGLDTVGRTIIYSDSDAILDGLIKFPNVKKKSSARMVNMIVELANRLEHNAVRVSFFWIPGHTGIPGNELADRVASDASTRIWCARERLSGLGASPVI
ncbi:RnaseH-domain-containing protein [Viridothelium virens]|uniref:ribonuclease H n=1 Tax=Viridothelium virens TaxID=1048519 RepID=A0A6A6GXU1_VIRVR|nr:RnaseH-domain-containing protein [Viridothelium virens]